MAEIFRWICRVRFIIKKSPDISLKIFLMKVNKYSESIKVDLVSYYDRISLNLWYDKIKGQNKIIWKRQRKIVYRVFREIVFYSCNLSLAGRDLQSSQRNASVHSLIGWPLAGPSAGEGKNIRKHNNINTLYVHVPMILYLLRFISLSLELDLNGYL